VSVRVLIVDDHAAMRRSLTQALASEPDLELVGEAADGASAVKLAEELKPDLIIMDVVLPRLNGIEATRRIKREHPEIQIVGLSAYPSKGYAARMMDAGADAYVIKGENGAELLRAVRTVLKGRTYLSPGIDDLDTWNG